MEHLEETVPVCGQSADFTMQVHALALLQPAGNSLHAEAVHTISPLDDARLPLS
jgi:hypothetical protein